MAIENRYMLNQTIENNTFNPKEWCFFQLIRFMECINNPDGDEAGVGYSNRYEGENIFFRQNITFAFQPSDIAKVNTVDTKNEVFVNFMGLLGTDGPMPLVFSEYVFNRKKHHHDFVLADFLDMFNHRMISFYYRAWADSQLTVSNDKHVNSHIYKYLKSLIGISGIPVESDNSIELNLIKTYNSAHYMRKDSTPDSLASVLQSYFKIPVKVKQFIGSYIKIPKTERYSLNVKHKSECLGKNIIIGKKYYSLTDKITIIMGPLNLKQMMDFMRGTQKNELLKTLIKGLIPFGLSYDLILVLKNTDIPALQLAGNYPVLGRTAFLGDSSKHYTNTNFKYKMQIK